MILPRIIFFSLALAVVAAFVCPESRATSLLCSRCGEPIAGKYVSAGGLTYHKDCFTCSYCGKSIKGKFSIKDDEPFHPACLLRDQNLVCAHCNKVLATTWVESDGEKYHRACFENHVQLRCGICGKPIHGEYVDHEDGAFHERCYKLTKLPRCAVCSQPVEGPHLMDAWGNKAHTEHGGREVDLCDSCGRIISQQTSKGSSTYSDGRIICGLCRKTAVMHLRSPGKMQRSLTTLLGSVGIGGIPDNIPLKLVNLDSLKQHSGDMFSDSARGFTMTTRYARKNTATRVDHTIFILSGLPLEEFKAVLAHELLHVWLIEHKVDLSHTNTEGFCNLGAMLVNQTENSPFSLNLLRQLENNPDPVYGDGYRTMKERLDRLGWDGLITDLLKNR